MPGSTEAGFAARNCAPPYGTVTCPSKRQGEDVVLDIDGDARPQRFFLPLAVGDAARRRALRGEKLAWQNGELHIPELPAHSGSA